MKAAFFVDKGGSVIDAVYSPATQRELRSLFDFFPGVAQRTDLSAMSDVEVLFSSWGMASLTEEEIAKYLPNLKAVFYGAGTVQSFARPFLARNIVVCSAWRANAIPVIEYATAQIILAGKDFYQVQAKLRAGASPDAYSAVHHAWNDSVPGNFDRAIGLLGLGAIGAGVARALQPYRMKILAYDPFCSAEKAAALGVELVSLEDLFSRAQIISNHVANLPATRGILNYNLFSRMLPNATFINTGRGAQVVEADLVRALREEPARTAVLDVTDPEPPTADHPFWTMPNVFLTPHIAGSAGSERFRMGEYMLGEAKHFLAGEPLEHSVSESMLASMA